MKKFLLLSCGVLLFSSASFAECYISMTKEADFLKNDPDKVYYVGARNDREENGSIKKRLSSNPYEPDFGSWDEYYVSTNITLLGEINNNNSTVWYIEAYPDWEYSGDCFWDIIETAGGKYLMRIHKPYSDDENIYFAGLSDTQEIGRPKLGTKAEAKEVTVTFNDGTFGSIWYEGKVFRKNWTHHVFIEENAGHYDPTGANMYLYEVIEWGKEDRTIEPINLSLRAERYADTPIYTHTR